MSSYETARSLALSGTHGCALRQAGLYCWGDNFAGQLGDGSTESSEEPVRAVAAGQDVVDVAASTGRTCVRRSNGAVACFGSLPIDAPALDAVQLAIDDASTCVVRRGGSVACWADVPMPETIAGLTGVVELRGAALGTYCARGREGWVRCFRPRGGAWTQPLEVDDFDGARALAVSGDNMVCAVMPSREVACHNLDSGWTIALERSEDSVALVGTSLVACAQSFAGSWTCWNILAPMLETVGSPAIEVPSEQSIVELAVGGFHACAVFDDDSVSCATAGVGPPELTVVNGLPP